MDDTIGLQSYSMTSWIIQAVLRRVFTGVVTDEEDLMHANGSPTSNTRVMHFAIVQTCRKALDGVQAILAAIYTDISSLLASPSEASSLMKGKCFHELVHRCTSKSIFYRLPHLRRHYCCNAS